MRRLIIAVVVIVVIAVVAYFSILGAGARNRPRLPRSTHHPIRLRLAPACAYVRTHRLSPLLGTRTYLSASEVEVLLPDPKSSKLYIT